MSYRPKTRLEKILNGMAVSARNGLEEAVQAAMERMKPLPVNATLVKEESGKTVVTLDKTAAELFAAAQAGRAVSATATLPVGEDTTGEITMILPIEVFRMAVGDTAVYTVKVRADADTTDALFFGDNFAGDDIVVLTEV